jgi:hypothetical protein
MTFAYLKYAKVGFIVVVETVQTLRGYPLGYTAA